MNHQTVHNSRNVPKLSTRWFKRKVQFSVLWSPRFAIRSSAIEQEGKVWPSQQGLHQPQPERGTSLDRDSLFVGKLSGGEQRHEVAIRLANSSFPDRLKPGKGRKYAWHEGGKRKIHCPQFVCSGLIRYREKQTFDYTNEMLVVMIGRFLANSHYRCSIISWFNEISGWNCAPPW